jgi:hypothetical protein
MTKYAVHDPDYSDTTEEDWDDPQLNDFDTDDLGEVAEHFVLSSSGFPPENFSDLKAPVVDPEGDLNLDALRTAYSGGHSVEKIEGIDDETVEEAREVLEGLAEEGFGVDEDELESPPD